jgi:Xaa-Pro aminopeptidase
MSEKAIVTEKFPPFSRQEYAQRLTRVREWMERTGIELLLVSDPAHMCYLHGYSSTWYRSGASTAFPPLGFTAVHIDSDKLIHFEHIDERALLAETSIVEDCRFYPYPPVQNLKNGLPFLVSELKASGWLNGRVGLEFHSYVPNRAVSESVQAALLDAGAKAVVDSSSILRQVRRIKSPQELEYIQQAARIADIGHRAAREAMQPGVTESEVWGEALKAMFAAGGEMPAINQGFKVASASPHAYSGRRAIQAGDFARLDICGVVHRYHANVARGYWMGEPPAEAIKIYETSAAAYEVLRQVARPGISVAEVCRQLREFYIDRHAFELVYFIGGYELGIAFPPDWVGEFVFDIIDEFPDGVFEANLVTNFESIIGTLLGSTAPAVHSFLEAAATPEQFVTTFNIDTVVYAENETYTLSALPLSAIVVD